MDDDRTSMQRYTHLKLPTDGKHYLRTATIRPGCDIHIGLRQIEWDPGHYHGPTTAECTGTARRFEALSYAWGPPEPEHLTARISIIEHTSDESQTSCGWLPVRSNLLSALQHLREVDTPRSVWIDAICINQDDDDEKSVQIGHIGVVYQFASRVVVWLGPSGDGSDEVMERLGELGLKMPDVDFTNPAQWLSLRYRVGLAAVSLQYVHRRDIDNLYKFICRAWFDRLWVRQEIFLAVQDAAIVQCGNVQVPWRTFCHGCVVSYITFGPRAPKELLARGDQLVGLLRQILLRKQEGTQQQEAARPTSSLANHRVNFSEALCNDPRDRIYATREMLPAELRAAIIPDYQKPAKDVFRDATIAYLGHTNDLTILAQCEYPPTWNTNIADTDRHPSWVPDWTTPRASPAPMLGMAAGLIRTKWELSNKDSILRVHGIVSGKIDKIRPLLRQSPLALTPSQSELRQAVCAILAEQKESLDLPYPAGGSLREAYIRTLVQNNLEDFLDKSPTSFQDARREVLSWMKQAVPNGNTETHGLGRSFASLSSFAHSLGDTIKEHLAVLGRSREDLVLDILYVTLPGWALFRTTDGLMGIAPAEAKPGDEVCVIFGSQQLLVLRPIPGEGNLYHVVGSCFQYGTMEGQAVLGPLPPDIRLGRKKDTWTFTNVSTGDESTEDPRAKNLGVDLENLLKYPSPKLEDRVDVDVNLIRPILAARGVQVSTFNLV